MGLGGVRPDEEHALGVHQVVVRVGHGAIAPGVRDTRHGRGVADAGLVIHVVRAEHRHELAEHVGLLVVVLGGAQPEHRVRAAFLADGEKLVADLVDGLFPGDLAVLAVHQLHRGLEAVRMLRHAVLAHRGALGAVRPQVEGGIEDRLLADPHAVLHVSVDGTAHRAVRADGALHLDLAARGGRGGIGLADHVERQLARERGGAGRDARSLQEGAAVDGLRPEGIHGAGKRVGALGPAFGFAVEQHGRPPQTCVVL